MPRFKLATVLVTTLKNAGTGPMMFLIAVTNVAYAILPQNTQDPKNGKEIAAHIFATQFLIFASTYTRTIQQTVWKEQIMLLTAVTHAWIALLLIIQSFLVISNPNPINVRRSSATPFMMLARKLAMILKSAKKSQMTLPIAVMRVAHAMLRTK